MLRPNDFTVRMLLTVSDIREPMNFSLRSDLLAIRLTTEMWMKLTRKSKGEKANARRPTFQQCTSATIRELATATELRVTIAMTPVIIL